MREFTHDFEVTAHDWLLVVMDNETDEFFVFHNDTESLKLFMQCHADDWFYGFNSKHYDRFIMSAIMAGMEPEEVKSVNDFIIRGGQGWECPMLNGKSFYYNNVDIMDDMQTGLSLKAIEGHLGMNIKETDVDFDIDRPLTDEELDLMIYYCKSDVKATAEIVKIRNQYLQTKVDIGNMVGISPEKALSMTNAKLTAAFLKAEPPVTPYTDERAYQIPGNLLVQYIPKEVLEFFHRMHDPNVSRDTLFKSKLVIDIYGTPTTIGFGGIHSAIPNYIFKEGDDNNVGDA